MEPTQRAALRRLVQRLLPELGQTELLSVLARRISGAIAHPALEAPHLQPLWRCPESLGWGHQYAQEEQKEAVFAGLHRGGEKVAASQIPVVTQFFTPAWVARFLVANSLGRLWLQMHPDSRLREQLTYLVPDPGGAEAGRLNLPRLAREIRLLDPACGAMHLGLAAYDLLALCYGEELARAGEPGWPASPSVTGTEAIPAAILTQNLHGVDVDPRVLDVARRVFLLKTGIEPPNLYCEALPLGALDRRVLPTDRFHVLLSNPPYLARRNMEPDLASYLAAHYPEGKGDLYTAFLQRALEWLLPGGYLAMITQSSFLFTGSFEGLRHRLLDQVAVEVVAHLGPGAFAEIVGEKVNTAAFVLRREPQSAERERAVGAWFRLLDGGEEEKRKALERRLQRGTFLRAPQSAFRSLAGIPFVYWLPPELARRFRQGPLLGERARFCRGISTAANQRFVRFWWEVGLEAIDFTCRSQEEAAVSPKGWFPYLKGGGLQRWAGAPIHVLDWAEGGRALRESPQAVVRNLPFQFQPGVVCNSVTGGAVNARQMEAGSLFDQASNALFPYDPGEGATLLALLNHPIASFTSALNPTVNIVAADLNRIPWPRVDPGAVRPLVASCIRLARQVEERNEISPRFRQPPLPDQSDLRQLLQELGQQEARLERLIDEGLALTPDGQRRIRQSAHLAGPRLLSPLALREAWVSYALSILMGRCEPGGYGGGPLLLERWSLLQPLLLGSDPVPLRWAGDLVEQLLELLLGPAHPFREVSRYLAGPFWREHQATYRRRPVFTLADGLIRASYRR